MAHCSNKLAALHPPPPPPPVPPAEELVTVVVELEVLLEFVVMLLVASVVVVVVVVNCCFGPRSGSAGDGSSVIRLLPTTVELLPVVAGCTGTPSAAATGAVAVEGAIGLSDVAVAPASVAEAGTRCCCC